MNREIRAEYKAFPMSPEAQAESPRYFFCIPLSFDEREHLLFREHAGRLLRDARVYWAACTVTRAVRRRHGQ